MEFKTLDHWKKEHQSVLNQIYYLADSLDKNQLQKQKFALLSKLIRELCASRDSKTRFTNLSSLIILLLNLYKKNYPLDKFSLTVSKLEKSNRKNNLEFKRILKDEFLVKTL